MYYRNDGIFFRMTGMNGRRVFKDGGEREFGNICVIFFWGDGCFIFIRLREWV